MIPTFLSLMIKSSLVAGLALSAVWLLNGRSPAERVTLLRAALVLLVALPVIALAGPDLTIWLAPASAPQAVDPMVLPLTGSVPASESTLTWPGLSTWLVLAWGVGAAAILARFGLGVLTLSRWTRSAEPVSDSAWAAPLARLAGPSSPRLLATRRIQSPLSWGVPPGVVLIGAAQLNQPCDAEAVLAHELAHIRRRDWLFLALSRVATALFWFNPLVWLLHSELGRLSEEAADADAVRHVDRETYARTLLGLAADFTPRAATGMTGPARSLAKRITKVMTQRRPVPPRPLAVMVAVGAFLAVATPLAAVELSVRDIPVAPVAPPVPPAPPVLMAALAPLAPLQMPSPPPPPPAPPRPPAHEGTYIHSATGPLGDDHRAAVAAAREAAAQARVVAGEARAHAAQARAAAEAHAETSRHAARTAAHARATAEHAARVQVEAEAIQANVAREMANVRVQMRQGAEQMVDGARDMREEARKLRDPAYRARQIERARERGQTVTDQELLDAIPKMESGADQMEAGAARMREQGANPG